MKGEGGGVREEGVKEGVREEGRGGGSELGSDQDLDPDSEPWKILWIQTRQNDADPLDPDPDPLHWSQVELHS